MKFPLILQDPCFEWEWSLQHWSFEKAAQSIPFAAGISSCLVKPGWLPSPSHLRPSQQCRYPTIFPHSGLVPASVALSSLWVEGALLSLHMSQVSAAGWPGMTVVSRCALHRLT